MPASSWPFLDHPGPLAFAHRGGAEEAPENTLAAFAAAVRRGYTHLETDIHATRDGRLVAFHDDRLERLTGRPGLIGDAPWAELAGARVGGEPIPLLEDLLASFPQARVNIDPKTDSAAELLPEALRRCDALARVCVGSFSDARLARLRAAVGPELCTSMGPRDVTGLWLAARGWPWARSAAACVQVPPTWRGVTVVDRRLIAEAHRRGLQVHVWTIDDESEMIRFLDLGVDGVMTDRPTLLARVLQARGQWPGAGNARVEER